MTKTKSTKRALLMSALSLLMCVSMLIGSTFAWFTDSVTSAGNKIQSGTLKLDLELLDKDTKEWNSIKEDKTALFDYDLWEPGYTEVKMLKVENEGTLALKWYAKFVSDADLGILADVIDVYVNPYGVLEDATGVAYPADRNLEGYTHVGTLRDFVNTIETTTYGSLKAGESAYLGIALKMQETAGNEYQDKTLGEFDIMILATQETYEQDSFNNQYDADAKYPGEVGTAEELAAALANNENVVLLNDIVLTGEWTPIGDKDAGVYYTGTFDGAGYTISGLTVSSGDYVALISAAKDATIKNLTVAGTVSGDNAAGIVARVEGETVIENCVSNVTVTGSTKAGGIACNVTGADAEIINCTNNGAISGGDNGIGGIVGYVNNNANLEIIKCTNSGDITSNNNKYAGAAVGYAAGTSTGMVANMTNSGAVTGTVLSDGRYLEYDGTVLCGYVGTIGNWTAGVVVADTDEFQVALDDAKAGMMVWLEEDATYGSVVMNPDVENVTIKGAEGAVVGSIHLRGSKGTTLSGITFDAAGAIAAYDTSTKRAYANVVGAYKNGAVGPRDLTIENCVFTGEFAQDDKYFNVSIAFVDKGRATGGAGDVIIKGCTFDTVGANYDVYGYYTGAKGMIFNIEGNTFAGETSGKNIYLGRLKTSENITVSGNTFENKTTIADAVSVSGDNSWAPTLVDTNNTFGN